MIIKRCIFIQNSVHLSLQGKCLAIKPHKLDDEVQAKNNKKNSFLDRLSDEDIEHFNRYFPNKNTTISLEEIALMIADNPAVSYSSQLLAALSEFGVMLVVCDRTHLPAGYLIPVNGYYAQSKILNAQITLSTPLKKSIWKRLVEAKIREQAQCIIQSTKKKDVFEKLLNLSKTVLSGDSSNNEALAARIYWKALFNRDFERIKDTSVDSDDVYNTINICLNYGYSIMRSLVARAICSVGLHPSFGVKHSNQFNPFCFADDIIEPLRPLVDINVWRLYHEGGLSIKSAKPKLVNLVHAATKLDDKEYPLMYTLQKLVERIRDTILLKSSLSIPNIL